MKSCPQSIKIEKRSDFEKLKSKNPLIIKYLKDYLEFFLTKYECSSISEFGAFYLLEDKSDLQNYSKMGLSQPINESVYEFTDFLTIQNSTSQIKLLHSCFLLNNDYAISVFIPDEVLDIETKIYLLEDSTEREVVF